MRFRVIAEPEPDYDAWLRRQAATVARACGDRGRRRAPVSEQEMRGLPQRQRDRRGRRIRKEAPTWLTWPAAKLLGGGILRNTPAELDALADRSAGGQAWQSHAGYAADRQ